MQGRKWGLWHRRGFSLGRTGRERPPLSPEPSVRAAATRPLLLHKETSVEATMIYTAWPHSRCPTYFDLWLECYSNTNLKEDEIQQRAFVGRAPRYSPFRCLCPCGERQRGGAGLQTWQESSSRVPSASVSLWMNLKQVQSFDVTEQNSNKVRLIKGVTHRPQTFCCPSVAWKENAVDGEATPADIHTRGGVNSASGPFIVHLKGLWES